MKEPTSMETIASGLIFQTRTIESKSKHHCVSQEQGRKEIGLSVQSANPTYER
jgi:hypothetical protein